MKGEFLTNGRYFCAYTAPLFAPEHPAVHYRTAATSPKNHKALHILHLQFLAARLHRSVQMAGPTRGKQLCRVEVSPNKVLHLPRNRRDPSNSYAGARFVAVLLSYQIREIIT